MINNRFRLEICHLLPSLDSNAFKPLNRVKHGDQAYRIMNYRAAEFHTSASAALVRSQAEH